MSTPSVSPPLTRGMGWRQPAIPRRGRVYQTAASGAWALSQNVDLRPVCGPCGDQQWLGACTGFAWAHALACLVNRAARDGLTQVATIAPASPLWIYYRERLLAGTVDVDVGASLADGLRVVRDFGVAAESVYPYNPELFAATPRRAVDETAARVRLVNGGFLAHDADSVLATLEAGYPIVFGTAWFSAYDDAEVAASGDLPFPDDDADPTGGHALLAVGAFRTRTGDIRVRFQNSWGAWGDGGFGTIPLATLTHPGLTGELIVPRALRAV